MGSNVDSSAKAAANTIVDRRIILPIDPSRSTWSLESRSVSEFQQRNLRHESERYQDFVSEAVVWLTVRMGYKRVNLTKPSCKDRVYRCMTKSARFAFEAKEMPCIKLRRATKRKEDLRTQNKVCKDIKYLKRVSGTARLAPNTTGKPRSRVMRTPSVQGL